MRLQTLLSVLTLIKKLLIATKTFELFVALSLVFFIPSLAKASEEHNYQYLQLGKMSLDKGDLQTSIEQLTLSIEKLPILADYALFWRAIAYERSNDHDKALKDLQTIKERYKDSPLIKQVRLRELELIRLTNKDSYQKAVEAYMKDYPSDYSVKFHYAQFLKSIDSNGKANRLFKEVFLNTHNSLASRSLKEIGEQGLSAEDLLKKANNLNRAMYFSEAEQYFKKAMKKDRKGILRSAIKEGLAYSYFRQKQYRQSAELYKERGDLYWYARSLLRARDIVSFEANLKRFKNSSDSRMTTLLIAYGNSKRRVGDSEKAVELFKELLSKQQEKKEREAILWALAWTYYLNRDHKNAIPLLKTLKEQYHNPKYSYWLRKAQEQSGIASDDKGSLAQIGHRDYYGYLIAIKNRQTLPPIVGSFGIKRLPSPLQRAEILLQIGLQNEAIAEAVHTVRFSGEALTAPSASYFLHKVGNHRYAVQIISRAPYKEEYHSLLYPEVYQKDIEEASRLTNLDPLLILAIIREESRYDAEARSIAGAMGLMQLMPTTAKLFERHAQVQIRNNLDLYEPKKNILIGAHYFRHLLNTFSTLPAALAAYNAGEEPVKEWLKAGDYKGIDEFIEDIPYEETNNYVKKVLTSYFEYLRARSALLPDQKLIGEL